MDMKVYMKYKFPNNNNDKKNKNMYMWFGRVDAATFFFVFEQPHFYRKVMHLLLAWLICVFQARSTSSWAFLKKSRKGKRIFCCCWRWVNRIACTFHFTRFTFAKYIYKMKQDILEKTARQAKARLSFPPIPFGAIFGSRRSAASYCRAAQFLWLQCASPTSLFSPRKTAQ